MSEEIKREIDEHGIPKPFTEEERVEARNAYIAADEKGKLKVLAQYPFIAGKDWQKYQPKPAAS